MPPNGVSILQQACLFLPHSQCPAGWACAQSASIQSQHLEYCFRKNTWLSLVGEGAAGMGKVPPHMSAATRHSSLSPQPRCCSHPRAWCSTISCSWEARLSFGSRGDGTPRTLVSQNLLGRQLCSESAPLPGPQAIVHLRSSRCSCNFTFLPELPRTLVSKSSEVNIAEKHLLWPGAPFLLF